MDYHVTTTVLAAITVVAILWLIRKDHLHPRLAVWWLGVAAMVAILGLFPGLVDRAAGLLGVRYPPSILFAISFVVVLLKLLRQDIARTRLHQTAVVLSQRVAVLEKQLEEREGSLSVTAGAAAMPESERH